VALVDIAPTPLRPLGEELGRAVADLHAAQGVDLHLATAVSEFEGDSAVRAVRLEDGTRLEADLVLVATGAAPNVSWLSDSGLRLDPGIVCEPTLEAVGATDVFAAGDVAQWPHPVAGDELVRVEHWSNAAEQARAAAANLLAPREERQPFETVPSFWSDQFELKVQSVGFPDRADRIEVVEGSIEEMKLVAAGSHEGRLVAAVAFNSARRIPWYRRAIAEGRTLEEVAAEVAAG
jgi:3-phenylpropionate/trans-cinnamate dioxygenase ferredoxin reductase component